MLEDDAKDYVRQLSVERMIGSLQSVTGRAIKCQIIIPDFVKKTQQQTFVTCMDDHNYIGRKFFRRTTKRLIRQTWIVNNVICYVYFWLLNAIILTLSTGTCPHLHSMFCSSISHHMWEIGHAYKLLVQKPKGKGPYGRPRCKWEDNIKMDLKQGVRCGSDPSG
jgi:hypothetical protein